MFGLFNSKNARQQAEAARLAALAAQIEAKDATARMLARHSAKVAEENDAAWYGHFSHSFNPFGRQS